MEIIPHLRSSTKGGLACVAKSLLQVCPLPSRLCLLDPPPLTSLRSLCPSLFYSSPASTTTDIACFVGENVYSRCVHDPSPHLSPPAQLRAFTPFPPSQP